MREKEESEKADLKLNIKRKKKNTHTQKPIIMASSIQFNLFMAEKRGNMEAVTDLISWAPKSLQMVTTAMKLKGTCSLKGKL